MLRNRLSGAAGLNCERPGLNELDWHLVLRAAEHHGLSGILHEGARTWDSVPKNFREGLEKLAAAQAQRSLFLTAELKTLLSALKNAGLHPIPYKGPVVAAELYGDACIRPSADLDLLLPATEIEPAAKILEGLNYVSDFQFTRAQMRILLRNQEEYTLTRAGWIHTELHWRIAPAQLSIDWPEDSVARTTRKFDFEGDEVQVLSAPYSLLALAVHGAKHSWSRLIWLLDLSLCFRRLADPESEAAVEIAHELGCERLLLAGLVLAKELLHLQLPGNLEWVASRRHTIKLQWAYQNILIQGFSSQNFEPNAVLRHAVCLFGTEGVLRKLRYLSGVLFDSTAEDIGMASVSKKSEWAYSIFRVARLMGLAA